MNTAQVIPWLQPGDALSNDAMAIAAQLSARGPATLHCRGPVHPGLAALVTPGDPHTSARVIEHVDERSGRFGPVRSAGGSVVLRVHALADPIAWSASFAAYDAVLATSAWGAQRAVDAGARRVEIVPPFLPLDAFEEAFNGSPSAVSYAIVTVGPFRMNDRLPDAVMVDHLVRSHLDPRAHLVAVGHAADATVARAVSELCDAMRLGSPWRGHLGHPEYVRALASAGALLHSAASTGFGAPIVEAMAAGTPVVARVGGAAAETLGGAGLLLSATADLTVVAEAVHAVLADEALRQRLRSAGRLRAAQLAPAVAAAQFDGVLRALGWW